MTHPQKHRPTHINTDKDLHTDKDPETQIKSNSADPPKDKDPPPETKTHCKHRKRPDNINKDLPT